MKNITIKEIDETNEKRYLDKIAQLEIAVLENMKSQGKADQLFITGKEDISDYIHSKQNRVIASIDKDDEIISCVYITMGQDYYTYNDLTKYFKSCDEYKDFVKNSYSSKTHFQRDLLLAYKKKIQAFEIAKQKILSNSNFTNILDYLDSEVLDDNNNFHEKSKLRELLNKYMSKEFEKNGELELFNKFYNFNILDIEKELNKKIDIKDNSIIEYEKIMDKMTLPIYEKNADVSKYFDATPSNTIEIDTYLTNPNKRNTGLARFLVFEGLKKNILSFFEENKDENEIYLVSTLHKKNTSSKYVSEFFGLEDNLYVKRRCGINREVHITRVDRENYLEYIQDKEEKLAYLYGYNKENVKVSDKRKKEILEEQISYEIKQVRNLYCFSPSTLDGRYECNDLMKSKMDKINILMNRKKALEEKNKEDRG